MAAETKGTSDAKRGRCSDTSEPKGPTVYRRVMIGTGIGAAIVTAGYAAAASLAGLEDVELSSRVGGICLTLILGLSLMSYSAWLVQRAEVNRDAIAEAVFERLADRIDTAVNGAADKNHARTITAFREIVTSELICEQLNAAAQRIHRYGMITEAAGRANVASIRRN